MATIDPIRDIPATRAGYDYRIHRFRALNPSAIDPETDPIINAAEQTWREEKDDQLLEEWRREAEAMVRAGLADHVHSPSSERFGRLHAERLRGFDLGMPYHLEFDPTCRELRFVCGGASRAVVAKGESLGLKNHAHEWLATEAVRIGHDVVVENDGHEKTRYVEAKQGEIEKGLSFFNKVLGGVAAALSRLGIAQVVRLEFPAAFTDERWDIAPGSKLISATVPWPTQSPTDGFDTVEFFLDLHRNGELPLAGENDVRALVMAIASPLLRRLLPGQLGVYWLTGPSGAGKDYLAELAGAIWAAGGRPGAEAKFDLTLAGPQESTRSLATNLKAVYARAKEAAKSREMIDAVIRLGGTDRAPARALYRPEFARDVDFTILADSVEDLPDRREISRRTVVINVLPAADSISKGGVLQRIRVRASEIIADLKRRIEAYPPEFFLQQAETGARPLGPAALAKVLGVALPEVKGGGLDELFDAMADYVAGQAATEEGKQQKAKVRPSKDGKLECELPSYRLSHFVEIMSKQAGFRDCFHHFPTGRAIVMSLHREAEYAKVRNGREPFLQVEVQGKSWAFRLARGDRNFVFAPIKDVLAILQPGPPATVIPIDAGRSERSGARTSETHAPTQTDADGAVCFDANELLAPNASRD